MLPSRLVVCCLALASLASAGCSDEPPSSSRVRVSFVAPAAGDVLSGSVDVRLAVEPGTGVDEVSLRAGTRELFAAAGDRDAVVVTVDTGALPDGVLVLEASATWLDGRTATNSIAVRVDNTDPTVEILSPSEGMRLWAEDASFSFAVRATDASGLARAVLRVDGRDVQTFEPVTREELVATVEPATLVPMGTPLPVDVVLEAEVEDLAGRVATVSRTVPLSTRLLWRFDTLGRIEVPPLPLPDGAVVVGTAEDHAVYVVEADGVQRCKVDVGTSVVGGPTLSADGTFAIIGTLNMLRAVDVADCRIRWSYGMGEIWRAAAAVASDGTVYAATYAGTLHALGPGGAMRWTYAIGGNVQAPPVLGPTGEVVVGSMSNALVVVGSDGMERFRFPTAGEMGAAALATPAAIFAGSYDLHVYGVRWTGTRHWAFEFEAGGRVQCAPTLSGDGDVVVCAQDGRVYALDQTDGTMKWSYETAGFTYGGVSSGATGWLYAGSVDGLVHAVTADGRARFRFATRGEIVARPVERAGILYVGSTDRKLYALVAGPTPP